MFYVLRHKNISFLENDKTKSRNSNKKLKFLLFTIIDSIKGFNIRTKLQITDSHRHYINYKNRANYANNLNKIQKKCIIDCYLINYQFIRNFLMYPS